MPAYRSVSFGLTMKLRADAPADKRRPPSRSAASSMKASLIVWDLETIPDLGGFAAANDLVGKSDVAFEPTKSAGLRLPGPS